VFCPGRGKWTLDLQVCTRAMSADVCSACFNSEAYFESILSITRARLHAISKMTLTVLSQYMKSELLNVGVPSEQVTVIPPFVHDFDPPAPPLSRDIVLFVGRLAAAKGVHDAVDAWEKSGTQLPLVFAGTGPERNRLEAAGHTVLGWVDRARLAQLMTQAAAVIVPSRWQEPFGIVGLEAAAAGAPVVAWQSGGVSEWCAEALVPWGDVEALARSLTRAIAAAPPKQRTTEAAPTLEALESVYRHVIEGGRGS
jgi:glycosyltransferase involved in cell wall biosynthesis